MSFAEFVSPTIKWTRHTCHLLTFTISFQPSYTTFERSFTFPKSRVIVAQDRVRQISSHITRSNTLANQRNSQCYTQKMAKDSTPPKVQGTVLKDNNVNRRMCGFCKALTIDVPIGEDGQPIQDKSNQLIPSPTEKKGRHPDFCVHLPPSAPKPSKISLFTAGSIEMGAAVPWQNRLIEHLEHLPITISNPRKDYWDPKVDAKSRDVKFKMQVEWELEALKQATVICFFYDTDTISPITLMELGLWANSGKAIVCCGGKYWRSGNVDIVCDRYNIPRVDSFEMLVPAVQEMLRLKGMALDAQGNLKQGELKPQEPEMREGKQWWLKYRDPAKLRAENEAKKLYADWKASEGAQEAS